MTETGATTGTEPRGLAARRGAVTLLSAVLDRQRMLEDSGLSGPPAERAEAHALADLTLRRLGQIDDLLGRYVDRMPNPPVLHGLRLMAAEIVFAGRAPHAAVDMAVRLVKEGKGRRLSGLVNAVGRRLAADGQIVAQTQDAARLNTPDWLWRKLSADWGTEHAPALAAAHLVPAPHDLTVRTPADTEALRTEVGGTLLPTRTLRLADRPQLSTLAGFAAGAWWAQDAASALPVRLFGPVEGLRVLDLCAAPGGKTLQLAAAGAHVTAVDLSERRMARVVENLARTGLAAETVVADVLKWKAEAPFDAVLLDAPCSATGTIRRHPDLPYRTDPKALERLTALQAKLMDRAWGWVAPGGAMVYATCSLLRAEGEEQSTAFAARHPEARLRRPSDPALGPFLNKAGALRTRPDQWSDLGGLDGFFAVCFQRS